MIIQMMVMMIKGGGGDEGNSDDELDDLEDSPKNMDTDRKSDKGDTSSNSTNKSVGGAYQVNKRPAEVDVAGNMAGSESAGGVNRMVDSERVDTEEGVIQDPDQIAHLYELEGGAESDGSEEFQRWQQFLENKGPLEKSRKQTC
jgi:hypothetical protein